jgi:hypothetical protein
VDAWVVLHVTALALLFGQTSKGRFRSCIEAHPRSKVSSPWKDSISQPWESDKGNRVYFCDFSG